MEDELFDKLQNISGKIPERFNILEEEIDVKLQLAYFKFSNKVKKTAKKDDITFDLENLPSLTSDELNTEDKKELLIKYASIDDPKAYRIIETYTKKPDAEIYHWSLLALQESKMLIESSLLDENQVFISTGLGGRGNMLRYFVVLIGENISQYEEFQQKMIKSEFDFALKNSKSELEHVNFEEKYALMTALIPFDVKFHNVLKSALEECNQYGNFLQKNFLITNVKKLSLDEVKHIVEKNKLPDTEDFKHLDQTNTDEPNEE